VERIVADRYRLEELLGASGMSEVWCAVDRKLERRVALRLLAPQADTSRFEREAHAVASLAHPNVVRLYDYAKTRPGLTSCSTTVSSSPRTSFSMMKDGGRGWAAGTSGRNGTERVSARQVRSTIGVGYPVAFSRSVHGS
jgi:hypothetical protein